MRSYQEARRRLRSVRIAVLGIVVMGISTLLGGCNLSSDAGKGIPPSTGPSAGSNRVQALMAAQVPLLAAANRTKGLDPQGLGLAGMRLDVERRTLEVYWKGDVPPTVREEMARQTTGQWHRVPRPVGTLHTARTHRDNT